MEKETAFSFTQFRGLCLGITKEPTLADTFSYKCSWEGDSGQVRVTTCQNRLLLPTPRIGENPQQHGYNPAVMSPFLLTHSFFRACTCSCSHPTLSSVRGSSFFFEPQLDSWLVLGHNMSPIPLFSDYFKSGVVAHIWLVGCKGKMLWEGRHLRYPYR